MTGIFLNRLRFLIVGLFCSVSATAGLAQARLMINNGGFVNITNSAFLVIENPAANAITRTTSGHIISEGENNIIKWSIGTTAAGYTIPLGFSTTNYIPVTFTTSAASGSGFFNFSTYRTPWNNSSQLPAGITTFNNLAGSDNSAFVLDRFWRIDAQSYTTKPTLSNLLFTYIDVEHSVASNTITEGNLKAQRYNSNINDWKDYVPAGTVSTAANTVTIPSVSASNLYPWWVLVDLSKPLPVELLSFSARPERAMVQLTWTTAVELNNDYFTIQRSQDGLEFENVGQVKGVGTTQSSQDYSYLDIDAIIGRSYYRLRQTDFDGAQKYSEVRKVEVDENRSVELIAFPNPAPTNGFSLDFQQLLKSPTSIKVYDLLGNMIFSKIIDPGIRVYTLTLNNTSAGVYIVKTVNYEFNLQQTVVLK